MIDIIISWLGGESKTVAFAIVAGVIGFFGKSIYDLWMARRKDKLERVNQQLKLLYGPLFSLVHVSTATWQAFVDQVCQTSHLQTDEGIGPQTPEAAEVWRHWIVNVFMPLNSQMAQLITEHADLLEEERMPDCLLKLSAHVHGYKCVLAAWDKGDYSRHVSLAPFPIDELLPYVEQSYSKLKNRQAHLIGRW
jgi:hypothetical protein